MNNFSTTTTKINRKRLLSIFCTLLLCALSHQFATAQSLALDNGFAGGVTDAPPNTYISATLPDGKVLVGGSFHLTNNLPKAYLVRLNSDGTIDNTFNSGGTGPSNLVYEIIVLADGKILISGSFTSYNGVAKGTLVRLNGDGSLDTTFNASGTGLVGTAQSMAVQADGKILASGGSITSYNGTSKFSVVRINADGSLDTGFTSPFTSSQFVEEVDVQADGKIYIVGVFVIGSPQQTNFARLNANGSIDTTFNPSGGGTDADVYALSLQPDGKILIGGSFLTYDNNIRPKIARINADGTLDTTFNPGSFNEASVEYFSLQTDGKILVAGRFVDIFGQILPAVRLNTNGTLDSSFQPLTTNDTGYSVKVQADGKVIVTGFFTSAGGQERGGIVRLNSNGTVDNGFNATFKNFGLVDALAVQTDGKVIAGGTFEKANGTAAFHIIRFNVDGSVDTTFNIGTGVGANISNFSKIVFDITVQPDGKILVGGTFSSFNGVAKSAIVRLNSDGTIDNSFDVTFYDPSALPYVYDILVQPDGKIMIGGSFTTFSQQFSGIYRINSNGSFDSTFLANGFGTNGLVLSISRQTDGKYIIGGTFTNYAGTARSRIARVNTDGSLDTTFNPGTGVNGTIWTNVLQPDGKIMIGGTFTTYNGVARTRIARINTNGLIDTTFNPGTGANNTVYTISPQINGKFLIGGFFSTYNGIAVNRLARINGDGSLDGTFSSGFENNLIFGVRDIVTDGSRRVYVGGTFTAYNGVTRNSVLRLAPRRTNFDFDGDERADISVFRPSNGNWYLNQSTAGFSAVQFGQAGDKLVPADFDGDRKTDVAVFRDGYWYILGSSSGFITQYFGQTGDIPQPADFNGDGRAELAVYRPSSGTWFTLNLANNQFTSVNFGVNSDKPFAADYDGDGKADYAVFRPSNGTWYLQQSTGGFAAIPFGISSDKPVPADYDGDGKTDVGVFRDGNWYILKSLTGFSATQFGVASDQLVPADFDGDGKADISVFRNGTWYLQQSTSGFSSVNFGLTNDLPIQSAFQQ